MRPLWNCFRQDKRLAWATMLAALVCLLPLAASSAIPFIDLPHHVALSSLLWDAVFGLGSAREFFTINSIPTPYWSIYLILGPAIRVFGVYAGPKIITGLCIVLVPLSIMRLLVALGRSPYLGLLAFLAPWDFNLYFGWLNHVLGMALAFIALALLVEAKSARAAMRVWPWSVLLAITHILPFGFFGFMGLLVTLLRPGSRKKAIGIFGVAISLPILVLLPWLIRSIGPRATDPGFVFESFSTKIDRFFIHSIGYGHITILARDVAMFAMGALVLIPLSLWIFGRKFPGRTNRLAYVPFFAAAILYFTLPLAVARPVEHWGTYPRFATPMLLGLLFLPNPVWNRTQKWTLIPAFAALTGLSAIIFIQFRAFDAAVSPLYEIVARIPRGAKLLPLCYENRFPMLIAPLGESLHGYIVGQSGAFNPYLFNQPSLPIVRKTKTLPAPAGWGRNPAAFSIKQHAPHYDYILVQGLRRDPVTEANLGNKKVRKIFESGIYRLYAVQ